MKTIQTDNLTDGMKISLMIRHTDEWSDGETRGQTDRQRDRQAVDRQAGSQSDG